jgi:hypothetical protein
MTGTSNLLTYNVNTFELTYSAKTFVIDHPDDPNNRYLVHGCLEGPEAGVYYRGRGKIDTGSVTAEVFLPKYVQNLIRPDTGLAVATPIWSGGDWPSISVGEYDPIRNSFTVHGTGSGNFSWIFTAARARINVEPLKENVNVRGDGPYRYI